MKKLLLLFVITTYILSGFAQTSDGKSDVQQIKQTVLNLRKSKLNALVHEKFDSLDVIFSENYKTEIANGPKHNKKSYLNSLKSGTHKLHKITDSGINVEVINNNLAIITGFSDLDRTLNSKRHQIKIRFVDVYYNENGTWKNVFYSASEVK